MVVAAPLVVAQRTAALTLLFQEDFESIPLEPPVDEAFLTPLFPEAFSHVPPPGWVRDASDVPGVGDPFFGVEEWEGWSFANKEFWTAAAAGTPGGGPAGGREFFDLGQGTIAVADPDQWNDKGNPANQLGFYNTLLATPVIDLFPRQPNEDRLVLQFDTSWIPGQCCNDGLGFNPGGDNQTANIYINLPDGGRERILRWESAPFIDNVTQQKTDQPFDQLGNPNEDNPFFQPDLLNDRVVLDVSDLAPNDGVGGPGQPPLLSFASGAASGGGINFEFEMEGAGDDGAWGIDNVEVASYGTVLGDMNLSGALESGDVNAFALGLQDVDEYRFNFFGEFPVTRGSLDSVLDFDDIPWFVDLLEMSGSSGTAQALALALKGVPEPGTLGLLSIGAVFLAPVRRRSPQSPRKAR